MGQVLSATGKLPKVYTGTTCSSSLLYHERQHCLPDLEISLFSLRRPLCVRTEDKKQTRVSKLTKNELLLINIGSISSGGRVLSVKGDLAKIQLTSSACTEVGEGVLCHDGSRNAGDSWMRWSFSLRPPLSCAMYACESVADPICQAGDVYSGVRYWSSIDAGDVSCPMSMQSSDARFVDRASMLYSSASTKGVLFTCASTNDGHPLVVKL